MRAISVVTKLPEPVSLLAAELSHQRGTSRAQLLAPLIREYFDANVGSSTLALLNNYGELGRIVSERARFQGHRPPKVRYLKRRPAEVGRKKCFQDIEDADARSLRMAARYFCVKLDDLAIAAIMWASGLPDDSTDAPKLQPLPYDGPKADPAALAPIPVMSAEVEMTPSGKTRPPGVTDFEWEMLKIAD